MLVDSCVVFRDDVVDQTHDGLLKITTRADLGAARRNVYIDTSDPSGSMGSGTLGFEAIGLKPRFLLLSNEESGD